MLKIGFSGLPSTGKTTLAEAVNLELKNISGLNRVEKVAEYARSYIRKYGPIQHISEEYRLVDIQREWEDLIDPDSTDIMLCDSPIQLAFLYATELNTGTAKDQMMITDIFKKISSITTNKPYDIIFHLPEDGIPVIIDDVRHECISDKKWRIEKDIVTKSLFQMFQPKKFEIITVSKLSDRVKWVIDSIYKYRHEKYRKDEN